MPRRPVFHVIARCQHVAWGCQPQVVTGEHQHSLIQIVNRLIALRTVGRRGDDHVADRLKAVDLVVAIINAGDIRRAGRRRMLGLLTLRLRPIGRCL
jgi:hypothetical protein